MSCCIVVPVYRDLCDPLEVLSFLRLRQLAKQDVFLVAPEGLDLGSYRRLWPDIHESRFDPSHFLNISAYSALMLSVDFYERFAADYDWLLIHQLDAFLFHNIVETFCAMPYDYFGAPWVPAQLIRPGIHHPRLLKFFGRRIEVGNGGLSLRRLASTLWLLTSKRRGADSYKYNEDGFFSYWGSFSSGFRSCPLEIARRFSFENEPSQLLKRNGGELPLGCHAFGKFEPDTYARLINPLLPEIDGLAEALGGRELPAPFMLSSYVCRDKNQSSYPQS
jgi:hypothetical protein